MSRRTERFLSPGPVVAVTRAFRRSLDNAVAAARTCYSASGIVTEDDVAGAGDLPAGEKKKRVRRRDDLARDLYRAGHHTTLQHAHYQFALSNVSRQFVWSFLHSHPFYNSEQVSQRYVEVKPGNCAVPPLEGKALEVYRRTVDSQVGAYRDLCGALAPLAEEEYFVRFPARGKRRDAYAKETRRRAQEVARYVLPVATFTCLYHTISALTLLRYHRMAEQQDAPAEQRIVLGRMVEELLRLEPDLRVILEEPIPAEETPEFQVLSGAAAPDPGRAARFASEFDRDLGPRISLLVECPAGNEALVAQGVREVLGIPRPEMDDSEAIALVMDPARNRYLGEALNLDSLSKLSRALYHARYTFRKRLSHTADSQNQRHRLTAASRPILAAHLTGEPDYAVPGLIRRDPAVERRYRDVMGGTWEGIRTLRGLGVPDEFVLYLLPNAVNVRFTESADLLNLRHKHNMRLCLNAQEEIWQASWEEALQIRERDPRIGSHLLPPCALRHRAGTSPCCPEGRRYCGVPLWKLPLERYRRGPGAGAP